MALLSLEKSKHAGEHMEYQSHGWFRESAAWDAKNRRFVVSFMEAPSLPTIWPRGRGFLVQLSSTGGAKSLADDVVGNAYVMDAYGNVIWKVSPEGSVVAVISSPAFNPVPAKLPFNLVGLNGIVYHPGGYLLAVHTWAGVLFKVSLDGPHVTAVNMSSFLVMGDGLELLTPERLVVAGMPSARIVESRDDWRSAKLTHRYVGPRHRGANAVTVKNGKAFVSHVLGFGLRKRTHLITEAVFKPVSI
ncbi:hypothetical protein SUGI_0390030 [Cryptomeria japonica]|nr:hypothetical protein SUGI_0390030 [Cryptomeria japonica]